MKSTAKFIEEGTRVLGDRSAWDTKQSLFTAMRQEGVRRQNKPFPKAADFHLALLDLAIRKQKSFWFGQVFNNDRVANFLAKRQQADYLTRSAAEWFDWMVRAESNCLAAFHVALDAMLLRGRGVLKSWVNVQADNALTFEGVDPQFILMADGAEDFGDADWFIHCKRYSRGRYERDARLDQSAGTWEAISGGDGLTAHSDYWQDKAQREGVTHTCNSSTAMVWECWEQGAGGAWTISTISPQRTERPLREPFQLTYKGLDGKPSLPFHSLTMEVKDPGWYSPRGLGDLVGPHEALGCKVVNDWLDALSFTSKPLFTHDGPLPNATNIRFAPGEMLPGNVKRVDMGQASMELPAMVNFIQGTAEQAAMMPDFGVGEEKPNDNRTATEINTIASVMNVGVSFNGEIIRGAMRKVWEHAWALLLQYRPKELSYVLADSVNELPEAALHGAYSIRVGGRADQWNQQQVFQRSVARYQLLSADPNANHEELVKDVLTADDPEASRRIFIPTNVKAANESEDEAQEISILADGFPAAVGPNEDHGARIHVLLGWLQKQQATGAPLDPLAMQRVQEHLAVHYQYLNQQNPEAASQVMAAAQQLEGAGMPGGPEGGAMPGEGAMQQQPMMGAGEPML